MQWVFIIWMQNTKCIMWISKRKHLSMGNMDSGRCVWAVASFFLLHLYLVPKRHCQYPLLALLNTPDQPIPHHVPTTPQKQSRARRRLENELESTAQTSNHTAPQTPWAVTTTGTSVTITTTTKDGTQVVVTLHL
uniref:Early protein E4 n=1 Tax=Human papillomavirus type 54 TaxID=1671798 RepID=A0A7G2A7X7_HPV54|nr:early protein E4 [Human papillomavirus type 54]